jgi:hypothetical protein
LTTHTIYEITGSGYGSETLRAHLIYMRGVSLGPEDKAVTETQPPAIEQIKYEMAPPGFSGVVHKMKDKGLTTEQAFTLAWSMYKKGHKAHVAPEGFVRRNRGMQCSESNCNFRTYSTTEADKHRRTVHLHLQESVKQADLDFLKSFDHNFEGMGPQLFLLPIAKVHGYEPLALATSVGESTRYSFVKHSTRPKDYLQLELKSDSKSYGTVAGWVRYSNGFANATRGRSVEELNRHLLESESPFQPSIAVGASEHPLPAQQPLKTDPSHSLPTKVAPVGPVLPDHPKHEDDMGMMTYDQPQANQADDDEQTPQDMDATDSDEAVGHPYYHGGNLSCPDCGAPYEVILSSTKDLECTQCHTKTPLSEMSPYRLIHHLDILSHHGFTPIASKHTAGKTTNSVYKNKDRHFIVVNPHNGSWAHHAGDRKVFGSRLPNLDQHLSRHYGNSKFVEAKNHWAPRAPKEDKCVACKKAVSKCSCDTMKGHPYGCNCARCWDKANAPQHEAAQPNMWAVKNKDAKKRHKLFAILAALHGNSGKYSLEDVNKALNAEGLPAIKHVSEFSFAAPVGGSAFTGRQMKQQMDADDDDQEGDTEHHMRFRKGHSPHQKHLHWMFSDDESVNEATEYKGGYKGIVRELPEPPNSRPNHKGSEWMGRIPLIHGYRQHTQANEAGAPMKFTHQTTDHVLTISRSMSDEGAREGRGWKIEHRGRMLNQGRGAAEMHSALRKIHTPHAKEARDLVIPANQHVDRKKRLLDRVKERKLRRVVGSKSTTESLNMKEDFTPEDPSMAREHLKKHGWHEVPGTRSNNSQSSFHVHADPKYSEHHFKVHPDGSWEHHKGTADGGGKIHNFKLKGKGHSAEQLHNYLSGGAKKPAAAPAAFHIPTEPKPTSNARFDLNGKPYVPHAREPLQPKKKFELPPGFVGHNIPKNGKTPVATPPAPKAHIPAPGPAKRPTPPAASPKAPVRKQWKQQTTSPAHRGVDKYGDGEIARNLRAKLGLQHGKKKKHWWEEVDADSDDQDPGAGGGANGEPNINQINKNMRDGTADAIQGKTDTVEPDEPLKPSRSGPNHKNAQ